MLDPASQRVLGALMEKEITTPEAYPLSLNALISACNQRSSRDPVMDLTEDQVRSALYTLEVASLIIPARGEGRVARFEHRIRTVLNLRRDETALLCLLLLRGPQTPGELRSRAERMFSFDDLAQVQATLDRLANRPVPVVSATQRTAGAREVRFRHLLGNAELPRSDAGTASPPQTHGPELADLQRAVQALEERVRALELQVDTHPGNFQPPSRQASE